ncbi:MAG: hypothetical protein J5669_08460 [Bacteroidales bacterium]|nr:hypothetical protein [Bacteroidales bacterium]
MKKVILAAAAALLSLSLNAQIFVGGQVGITTNSNVNKLTNNTASTSDIVIAPNAGYVFSDDFAAGVRVPINFGSNGVNDKTFGIGVNPYARYVIFRLGNFGISAEAGIRFNTTTETITTPNVAVRKITDTEIGIEVLPVLTYGLTDHITLEANLNIARLAFTNVSSKDATTPNGGNENVTVDSSNTGFNLGANTNDVFGAGVGAVTIGFTYKF